jgi:transposase-like protein
MLPAERRARIIAALKNNPNAAQVARQIGDVSPWTVRRFAKAASIVLSVGKVSKGHHRVSIETRAQIIAALQSNPNAAQVARQIGGVSRMTVWKIARVAGIDLTAGQASRVSRSQR